MYNTCVNPEDFNEADVQADGSDNEEETQAAAKKQLQPQTQRQSGSGLKRTQVADGAATLKAVTGIMTRSRATKL